MFQLSKEEFDDLRCQTGISTAWGGRRYRPHAFTEQGIAMLSGVLGSKRAVDVNIEIMRTFVRLRHLLQDNVDLAARVRELELEYDRRFKAVFDAIHALLSGAERDMGTRRPIGFVPIKD